MSLTNVALTLRTSYSCIFLITSQIVVMEPLPPDLTNQLTIQSILATLEAEGS